MKDARRAAPARGLGAALAALALLGIAGNAGLAALGEETVLRHTAHFLAARQGADSWRPMVQAHAYLERGGSETLYDRLFFERRVKFIYPPTSLLWIEALDRTLSRASWQRALNVTSWLLVALTAALAAAVLDRALGRAPPRERALRAGAALVLSLTFYPVVKAYSLGQAQVLVNAALAGLVLAWQRGAPRTAGVLVAVMAALKPQYALIGVWGLLRGRWAFAAAAAAAGLALLALSVALFGWDDHLAYLRVLSHVGAVGEAFHPNQTVNGLLNRLLGTADALRWDPSVYPTPHPVVRWGTLASSALFLGVALFGPVGRGARGGVLDLAVVALAATLASPIAWEHHYGVLLPLFALLVPAARERGLAAWAALAVAWGVGASYLAAPLRHADVAGGLLLSTLFATALGVWIALVVLRARAPSEPESTPPDGTGSSAPEASAARASGRVEQVVSPS